MRTIKCKSKFIPGDVVVKIGESDGHKVFSKVVIQAVEYKACVDDTTAFNMTEFKKADKYVEVTNYKIRYVTNDEIEYIRWPCSENELITMREFEKLMKENNSTYEKYLNWVNSKDWTL